MLEAFQHSLAKFNQIFLKFQATNDAKLPVKIAGFHESAEENKTFILYPIKDEIQVLEYFQESLGSGKQGSVHIAQSYDKRHRSKVKGYKYPWRKKHISHEVECLKRLNRLHFCFVTQNMPNQYSFWIVSELFKGFTLSRVSFALKEHKIQILKGLLKELQILKYKKIIHRDIKPDNIIVSRDEKNPSQFVTHLIDFGYALACDPDALNVQFLAKWAGNKFCTPPEINPNQDGQWCYTPKVDMYAIGVIAERILQLKLAETADGFEKMISPKPNLRPTPAAALFQFEKEQELDISKIKQSHEQRAVRRFF